MNESYAESMMHLLLSSPIVIASWHPAPSEPTPAILRLMQDPVNILINPSRSRLKIRIREQVIKRFSGLSFRSVDKQLARSLSSYKLKAQIELGVLGVVKR